jgi:ABC-type nickel/cobalt efflux system permease component RcnA
MMGAIVVTVAVAVSLGTGLMIGVIAMVAMAVRREDTQYSLTRQAPGVMARGVRRLTGVGLRDITPPVERIPSGVWVRP